mmetsp:Transcript_9782/g.25633  ORF Transcript_9782/g.25633 Transcript_9782/m.25633 type:complete len:264 (-) Transcript_9782:50-841(-)
MRKTLLEAKGHKIYWLALDAVQHHLMIEKCRGRYRVFQTNVKDEGPLGGYTAEEWCSLDGLPGRKVHQVYGGGLTVGDTEINQLLDLIVQLQNMPKVLLSDLLRNVPGVDQSSVHLLAKDPTALSKSDVEKGSEALQLASKWSHTVIQKVPLFGITTLNFLDDPVVIVQGNQKLFEIPQKRYSRVRDLYQGLTGQASLTPVVFVKMVNQGFWWENRRDPRDGGATGYGVRGADLGVRQSYEQGVEDAKILRERVKSFYTEPKT